MAFLLFFRFATTTCENDIFQMVITGRGIYCRKCRKKHWEHPCFNGYTSDSTRAKMKWNSLIWLSDPCLNPYSNGSYFLTNSTVRATIKYNNVLILILMEVTF